MASCNLLAQRSKIQRQIETLERLVDTNNFCDNIHIASSDSCHSNDEGSEDSEQEPVSMENLAVKRKQIQREIKELELSLSQDTPGLDIEILSADDENDTESIMETSGEDSDEVFSLPPNVETCLQMNLVYQDVLEEKLTELERLLVENKEQQKEVMVQVSGPAPQATTSGLPPLKVFLGNFMKPYFKDKVTGLGPPANSETRDKMNMGTRSYDEMKIRRWEGWQKTLLLSSVVSDTMKRLLQPKLSKLEYLNEKMAKAEKSEDMEEQILQKQINQIEREIDDISSMSEEQLMGSRHDDHDWEKISNIDFEGTRSAEDIRRFWGNYLHPSVNKSSWKEDEIEKLKNIVENRNYCKWDQIAQELGTNRTAFMCLQTHQRYIHKGFKKKVWTKEEDQVLRELVEKMRIGNFIPYTQISYFMEGREAAQLVYRWTQVLDPTVRKGPWTKEEDEMLLKAVTKYGVRDWWKIRNEVPGRTDAQCRERYLDCLSEDVKKGRWSPEEEAMLINLVRKYGAGRWSKIASEMPNRIDSQCLQKWKIMTGYPRCRLSRWTPRKNNEKSKKGTVRNQGIGVSCEGQSSVAHPAWNTRISVASHVCSTYCTTLNDELLHAITPWMGNLILPLACKKDERCKVDVTREKTKTTGLTSTPVFSLFLKILFIDAEGCKKVIEARTRAEICIPHQQAVTPPPKISPPPPKISASSAPSRKRTVIQMLDEKHKQEYGKKKEDQKQSSLIMMIPQPLVITQPLLQGIEPPVAPTSSAPDKPAIAKGMETYSIYKTIQSQKRTRKPAEKAKVLLAGSKVNLPKKLQNHKKACLQNSCLKDGKKISQVPLCPQPPITWIVTPNGLLPVSGLGIPVSTQAPPAEMKSVSSNVSCFRRLKPIAIKSNNSLTFSINGAPGAEVPPDVLHVCPSVCIPADLPTSSFGERIALNLAPTTSTSTDTLVGRVTCPNNSVSSLSSVSVPHCNSVCAQLPVHFLAAEPVSTIMPVPASVNAGRSVANPTYTVAEVSSLTPLLTYSQGLPILQVCQPQTSQIIATTFVNPVMPPAKITSLPQQQVFSRLKPNDSPLKLATKPALPKSPKPEHILSFDPGLVSAEETSHVTEWMKGVGGIRLTRLDATLPYLPPFVSNLTTLTTLLKCKPDLERCALPLVSPNGESSRVEAPEKGIRRLVAERLSSNQAYLLLKARFLSCFSLPAFLATVYPHENANSVMFTPAKYSKCEESVSLVEDADPGGGEGMHKDRLLRTDGKGTVADEFSGIAT
ncbi:snRNA-activating protein complex subunit 4 isoform X5 [Anguilla anguilla]|uniref:snRNA-activating protein complex subunit 4 isoform X5 n=1 Tax=Anguilla anguilla TaxID=7936 RepID=UPI0015AFCFE5|nr:snRNA-activating protein complex subunit 4 isoform X5 [Anguilla anguilla]